MGTKKLIIQIPHEERVARFNAGEKAPSTHKVVYVDVPSRLQKLKTVARAAELVASMEKETTGDV